MTGHHLGGIDVTRQLHDGGQLANEGTVLLVGLVVKAVRLPVEADQATV